MGIYTNGAIFGIRLYNVNADDFANILFEKKYAEIMSREQMRDAYILYKELNINQEIRFQYYTECSSTYGAGTYFNWCPMQLMHPKN